MSDATGEFRVQANKATVRHMLERLSAGDVAGFTDHLSPDYVRHSQAMPQELQEIRGEGTSCLFTEAKLPASRKSACNEQGPGKISATHF